MEQLFEISGLPGAQQVTHAPKKLGGDSVHSPGVWCLAKKKVGSELVRLAVGNYSAIKSGLSLFPPDSSFGPGPFDQGLFRPLPKSTAGGNRSYFAVIIMGGGQKASWEFLSLRNRETQQETGRRVVMSPLSARAPPGWKVRSVECRETWPTVWRKVSAETRY